MRGIVEKFVIGAVLFFMGLAMVLLLASAVGAQQPGEVYRTPDDRIVVTRVTSDRVYFRYRWREGGTVDTTRVHYVSRTTFRNARWLATTGLPANAKLDSMHLYGYPRGQYQPLASSTNRPGPHHVFEAGDIFEVCAIVFSGGRPYPAITNERVAVEFVTNGPLFRFGDPTPTGQHCRWLHVTQRVGINMLDRSGIRLARRL